MKRDINQLANHVVKQATDSEYKKKVKTSGKNAYAASIGHLGGIKGGRERAAKLTESQRKEVAQKAAHARWLKKN